MGNLFSVKGHLDISNIICGAYEIINLKMSLLEIYWMLSPTCSCLCRAGPDEFTGQDIPTPALESSVPGSYRILLLKITACLISSLSGQGGTLPLVWYSISFSSFFLPAMPGVSIRDEAQSWQQIRYCFNHRKITWDRLRELESRVNKRFQAKIHLHSTEVALDSYLRIYP